jgi:DNA-binding transcriptional MerR regulator
MMNEPNTYTLEELAEAFDLTPRTTRHYIENVLPPHHKTGRGKLARYGKNTWNCFAFIQRVRQDAKLSTAQLSDVLARLDQDQIDRVAEGREELAIYVAPGFSTPMKQRPEHSLPRASMRARARSVLQDSEPKYEMKSEAPRFRNQGSIESIQEDKMIEMSTIREKSENPSWQKLYTNERLRILYKGEISKGKREQMELAAELIGRILSDSE